MHIVTLFVGFRQLNIHSIGMELFKKQILYKCCTYIFSIKTVKYLLYLSIIIIPKITLNSPPEKLANSGALVHGRYCILSWR